MRSVWPPLTEPLLGETPVARDWNVKVVVTPEAKVARPERGKWTTRSFAPVVAERPIVQRTSVSVRRQSLQPTTPARIQTPLVASKPVPVKVTTVPSPPSLTLTAVISAAVSL